MIYNPYNTTVQTPGVAQPGMIGQPTPALGAYPTTPVQAGFPMMQQSVMPVDTYQQVMTQQPVMPVDVQPKPVAPVAQPVQKTEPQVASTQTTTAKHKKTTYVEAYLEPVDAKVPLMQPTVSKQVVDKKQYPVSDELVYVDQQPLKSSTQQDYNLYLMQNEYYANSQIGYQATVASQPRADQVGMTCETLPLATTYVKSQTYQGYNTPAQTMQQGTGFNELYSPYTPKKVTAPTVFIFKGGQR